MVSTFASTAPTNFRLSLKNAGLSRKAIGNLRNSGRVLNLKALQQVCSKAQFSSVGFFNAYEAGPRAKKDCVLISLLLQKRRRRSDAGDVPSGLKCFI